MNSMSNKGCIWAIIFSIAIFSGLIYGIWQFGRYHQFYETISERNAALSGLLNIAILGSSEIDSRTLIDKNIPNYRSLTPCNSGPDTSEFLDHDIWSCWVTEPVVGPEYCEDLDSFTTCSAIKIQKKYLEDAGISSTVEGVVKNPCKKLTDLASGSKFYFDYRRKLLCDWENIEGRRVSILIVVNQESNYEIKTIR